MSTHSGLTRCIQQLEKQSRADEKSLTISLGDQPEQSVRLPRAFVEFLANSQVKRRPDRHYFNHTDGEWVEG
jgi:hypothetical protein